MLDGLLGTVNPVLVSAGGDVANAAHGQHDEGQRADNQHQRVAKPVQNIGDRTHVPPLSDGGPVARPRDTGCTLIAGSSHFLCFGYLFYIMFNLCQ